MDTQPVLDELDRELDKIKKEYGEKAAEWYGRGVMDAIYLIASYAKEQMRQERSLSTEQYQAAMLRTYRDKNKGKH